MAEQAKPDDIIAFHPDQTLRQLIGKDTKLAEVFTPERIAACQNTIDKAKDSFFQIAGEELAELEALLAKNPDPATVKDSVFEDFAVLACDVKGQADTYGFSLVSAICNHIVDDCEPGKRSSATRFQLIAGLVKLLHVAIKQKITDDRGTLAQELKASLKKY